MQTLQEIHHRQRRIVFFLLALFVLGWGFTEWKPIFAGLILGSLFGLYNFWILVRRMEKFDRKIAEGKKERHSELRCGLHLELQQRHLPQRCRNSST